METSSQPQPGPIRVSIVDDDEGIRTSLSQLLGSCGDFACVSAHPHGRSACAEIPKIKPDVVLMDINLGSMDGIECVARLKAAAPELQIVMLTVYEETEKIYPALEAGAAGYLLKRTSSEELFDAIRQVHRGESPMSGPIARKVVQFFQRKGEDAAVLDQLTPKEYQVLDHLARGFLYKEIAQEMSITLETVRTHIRSIYQKLQVNTRTDAVLKWLGKR
ncbi:MAG TPA: DNA-binding response regulator [Verrucomicrobiales bacterium]|nr:DNA-binding response regulator [Verrucomicrobiales bacterium]